MRLAVAGGTGLVGSMLVEQAKAQGDDVVVLARSHGTDLTTGAGLADRLDGVEAVVDVTNVVTTRRSVATGFFRQVTERLLHAEEAAGVGHHVVLSIVGVDQVPFGYYEGKVGQERLVRESGRPHTVLRATQFHEFPGQLVDRGRVGPLALVPRLRSAPVAASEVAAYLLELAHATPSGRTFEIGGPEEHDVADLARRLLRARGSRTRVVGLPVPGRAGRAIRGGALLPPHPDRTGKQRFDAWLAGSPR